jgi:hypothetical protein
MDQRQNVEKAFVAVITGALKAGLGETVLESIRNKIIGAAIAEATKCAAEGFVGPVLRVVLGLLDETSTHLKQLMSEPLITGIREAMKALSIGHVLEPADEEVVFERLHDAEVNLSKALTLLPKKGQVDELKFLIQLLRGLIASRRGALVMAAAELQFCKDRLAPQLQAALEEKEYMDQAKADRKVLDDAWVQCGGLQRLFQQPVKFRIQKPQWQMSITERLEKAAFDAEQAKRNAEDSSCMKRVLGSDYDRLFGSQGVSHLSSLLGPEGDFAKHFADATQRYAEVASIVAFLDLACIKPTGNEYPEAVSILLRNASELAGVQSTGWKSCIAD